MAASRNALESVFMEQPAGPVEDSETVCKMLRNAPMRQAFYPWIVETGFAGRLISKRTYFVVSGFPG